MKSGIVKVGTVSELRKAVSSFRASGLKIGMVPTMGALHEGHLSLVRKALEHCDKVVVSIFVNPTQFAPGEDYERYPRNTEKDCELLQEAGANLAFIPEVTEMYPLGNSTSVHVEGITKRFEGEFRPGHFDGVATVVAKLLLQCLPDVAVFGEKDYQQLAMIRRMVTDLSIPVDIIAAPIVRDPFGLALSSRNSYLSEQSLANARKLNQILAHAVSNILDAPSDIEKIKKDSIASILEAGFERVDYFEIVDESTLEPLNRIDRPARILCTARIQGTRLLDNISVRL